MRISRIHRVRGCLSCVELIESVDENCVVGWTTYDLGSLPSTDFLSLSDKHP